MSESEDLKRFLDVRPVAGASPPRRLLKDLVTSKAKLGSVYALATIFGYLTSLAICAQCSVGISPLAWKTESLVHRIPDPWCPLVCGTLFGIFPVLASTLFLTRFQHRFLLFRMAWVPITVPVVASFAMTAFGASHDLAWSALWLLAAIGTPYGVELVSGLTLRQRVI